MRSEDIHILGAGQLVQEILPYLKKQAKSVVIHVRDIQKVSSGIAGLSKSELEPKPQVHALEKKAFTQGALIIAAPVSAAYINEWLAGATPKQIFDLRDTATIDPLVTSTTVLAGNALSPETFKLSDIFAEITETKKKLEPLIENVRTEIQACTDKVASSAIIRPLGWDDLCA